MIYKMQPEDRGHGTKTDEEKIEPEKVYFDREQVCA
jgi:hypothetical protein